jgi:hypothetical protein
MTKSGRRSLKFGEGTQSSGRWVRNGAGAQAQSVSKARVMMHVLVTVML